MNGYPRKEVIISLRRQYPKGTRVELVSMSDPYTRLKPGDQGEVLYVDDIGTIHVLWNSGSTLGVAYGEDHIRKI